MVSHSFPNISSFQSTISKALSFCGRMALALCNAVSPVKKTYQQHAVPPNSRHGYISQKTLVSTASHGLNPWRLVNTRLPCCCCNVKSAQAASLKRETRKNGTENMWKHIAIPFRITKHHQIHQNPKSCDSDRCVASSFKVHSLNSPFKSSLSQCTCPVTACSFHGTDHQLACHHSMTSCTWFESLECVVIVEVCENWTTVGVNLGAPFHSCWWCSYPPVTSWRDLYFS